MNTTQSAQNLADQILADQDQTDATPDSEEAQLLARRLAMLDELCRIGMEVARELPARAQAIEDVAGIGEVGLTFSRVARSLRQIVALEQELTGKREDRKRYGRRDPEADRKAAIDRGVKSAIRNAARIQDPGIGRDGLRETVENLFDDYDDYDDLDYGRCSVGEAIAGICRDLGIETDPFVWDDDGYPLSDDDCAARHAAAEANSGKPAFPDPVTVHHQEPEPSPHRLRPAGGHGPPGR